MAMFAAWVSFPFLSVIIAERKTLTWAPQIRLYLYALMEAVAILSVIAYSGLVGFEGRPTAFVFLVVPAISLAVIVAAYLALSRMKPPAE